MTIPKLRFPLRAVALLAAGISGQSACKHVEPPSVAAAQSCIDRLIEADNRGDLDAAMRCYGRDALLVPPQGAEIRGHEAVREHYARIFATSRPALRVEHLGATSEDGTVVDRGRTLGSIMSIAGGSAKPVDDEYEARLCMEDGAWRVVRLRWHPRGQDR